jgi:hypothetical protein
MIHILNSYLLRTVSLALRVESYLVDIRRSPKNELTSFNYWNL